MRDDDRVTATAGSSLCVVIVLAMEGHAFFDVAVSAILTAPLQSGERRTDIMAGEPQRQVNLLFPTVVRTVILPEAAGINTRLMPAISDLRQRVPGEPPDSWSCSLYTTFKSAHDLHQQPGFEEVTAHIVHEANVFAGQLGLDLRNEPLSVRGSWINIYGPGHSQEVHVHANSLISAVYYVKAPQGVPGLMIHSPFSEQMLAPPVAEVRPENMTFDEVPAVEGEIILFRSWTRHSVRPNTAPGERISIAFNLS